MHLNDQLDQGDNLFVGGSRYFDFDQDGKELYALAIANLDQRTHQLITLNFFPHGVCLFPKRPELMIVCEKKGPNGAILNLDSLSKVSNLPLPSGRQFYGHCAFSADGQHLYTTEVILETGEGLITQRDGMSGEITGEFPSFGHSPHECQLLADGKTMVVTNGGGKRNGAVPNIAYIDIDSKALIKHEKTDNFAINTGHFCVAEDSALVVVSAPREGMTANSIGGVSIQPKGKVLRTVSKPKKTINNMVGEALSVIAFNDMTLVTHPDGDMVTVWSTTNRNFIKRFDLPKPRGLAMTRDKKGVVIAFGPDSSLIQLDAKTLELKHSSHYPYAYISGSHLYNLAELRES